MCKQTGTLRHRTLSGKLTEQRKRSMGAGYYIGDAIQVMATLPEKSVDLILSSPPFLALRSYLPADHPLKSLEGGAQATPGAYIDWLVDVAEACDRVLAPHGSMCFELGDTYCGARGYGTPEDAIYGERHERLWETSKPQRQFKKDNDGWPLAKSLSLIPELFRLTLVYGFNPLTGRQTERWRLRNVIRWVRPNPSPGALGDKFRPATSELMVFCKSAKRFFDLDAVREPYAASTLKTHGGLGKVKDGNINGPKVAARGQGQGARNDQYQAFERGILTNPAGAPPLDWWNIPPGGYSGTTTWTERVAVDPRESVGDIWRTTSADCPVHADHPGLVATALHDEPVFEDRPDRNLGKGANPAPRPLPGSAPIDPLPLPNLEDGSSDSTDPLHVPAAIRRSKASSKKGRAPVTSSLDTAFDKSPDRTLGTPEELPSDEPHPGIPESRTSGVCLNGCTQERCDHSFDRSSEGFVEACTCSYWVLEGKSISHYAVWPPELCVKPIKAMCPEKVCRECGEPSRRIVGDTEYVNSKTGKPVTTLHFSGQRRQDGENHWDTDGLGDRAATRIAPTLGFSDCGHDNWRPGLILDPFAGSGTTLAVATGHGRDAIGIDLDERNYQLALQRVGPFLLELAEI